jgi:hypothetical protein
MNKYTIIPSNLEYKSAPSVDQEISISLDEQKQQIIEYDRNSTVSLSQVFDDERQASTIFRPTFKIDYIYANTFTGTTVYTPFQYNLYYVNPEKSAGGSGISWKGFPQYYEFDFFRPDVKDQHIIYKAKSAYTYNWTYYLSYPYKNNYDIKLYTTLNSSNGWKASEGIPFSINNSTQDGNNIISFQCISPHGLTDGEYVELSFYYNNSNLFQVYSLGNDKFESGVYIFNIFNLGYTGTTFRNGTVGTFKRVINPDNLLETKSKYYVREHKILTNLDGLIMTKDGFEKNIFNEEKKFEYSSITPNKLSRISQKTSSNSYNITTNYDLDLNGILDNQMRPISELFLTIVNKGYTGYFNQPNSNNVGLKQGWEFNLTSKTNFWWDLNNVNSNTNVKLSSYQLTDISGNTKTFYYNQDLMSGDTMDGDFCEWNDYEQIERVISPYYHKIKYNQNVFQTTNDYSTNSPGYYYRPHNSMTIKVFSDYVETGDIANVDAVPNYSFFSNSDQQFRWRDLYSYGYIDSLGRGVDYPFLNSAQYPYKNTIFRLIPEGINYNSNLLGTDISFKPLIDACE